MIHPEQHRGYDQLPEQHNTSAPTAHYSQQAPAQYYQGQPAPGTGYQQAPPLASHPAYVQSQAPPPQQQQQYGGPPADRFARIRQLPMFPMVGDKEQKAMASVGATCATAVSLVNPNAQRKAANHMWNAVSASGNLASSTTLVTGVLTRWAAIDPATGSTIIIDVWEGRGSKSWMANTIWLVSNADARIRVREKWEVKVKRGKRWTKDLNTKPLESVTLLSKAGGGPSEIEFEIVERQQRPVAPLETPHIKDRFKTWVVPA